MSEIEEFELRQEMEVASKPNIETIECHPSLAYDNGDGNYPHPEVGSLWLNTRKMEIYKVIGRCASCDNQSSQFDKVLYYHPSWGKDCYRDRPLTEWYGKNRDGMWRFLRLPNF